MFSVLVCACVLGVECWALLVLSLPWTPRLDLAVGRPVEKAGNGNGKSCGVSPSCGDVASC